MFRMFGTVWFFRGYRSCLICRISQIPEGCLFGSTPYFRITRTCAGHRRWLFYLSNQSDFQILPSWTMFDLMPRFRRYSEHPLTVLESDFRRSGVQQCSIFPEVITDNRTDALFVGLGGFPRINFFDTAQFAEFVGWPKMFDNVPFFSEIIQDVDLQFFARGFKRSDE